MSRHQLLNAPNMPTDGTLPNKIVNNSVEDGGRSFSSGR
jgi:hypothetical protein